MILLCCRSFVVENLRMQIYVFFFFMCCVCANVKNMCAFVRSRLTSQAGCRRRCHSNRTAFLCVSGISFVLMMPSRFSHCTACMTESRTTTRRAHTHTHDEDMMCPVWIIFIFIFSVRNGFTLFDEKIEPFSRSRCCCCSLDIIKTCA